MTANDILGVFELDGIVPAIIIENANDAIDTVKAMAAGGIHTAEITFRSGAAGDAITQIAKKVPECIVGAGTVLTVETAKKAVDAGAQFVVSPGLNPDVVRWCTANGVPVVPGVATPTEIELGLSLGLTRFKFFPAEANGGIKTLKAYASPYQDVKFLPTGGVNDANSAAYLSLPNVFAVGGSWICPKNLITGHDFDGITALCADAVAALKKA